MLAVGLLWMFTFFQIQEQERSEKEEVTRRGSPSEVGRFYTDGTAELFLLVQYQVSEKNSERFGAPATWYLGSKADLCIRSCVI